MWVPSLIMTNPYSELPTGLIFSAFMLSMTIGGMLFGLLLPIFPYGVEGLCLLVYIAAALAMAVPVYYFNFWSLIISFLALEAVLGMFNSCGGTLRSQLYPEAQQSSIMSVFRLPLNLLVAVGTKLADSADTIVKLQDVFFVVVCMHVVAAMLHFTLMRELSKQKQKIN